MDKQRLKASKTSRTHRTGRGFLPDGVYEPADPNDVPNYRFWIMDYGLEREVLQYSIGAMLGNNATCRPARHTDGYGVYLIAAPRSFTDAQLEDLRNDSAAWRSERSRTTNQSYALSTVLRSRQYWGTTDSPTSPAHRQQLQRQSEAEAMRQQQLYQESLRQQEYARQQQEAQRAQEMRQQVEVAQQEALRQSRRRPATQVSQGGRDRSDSHQTPSTTDIDPNPSTDSSTSPNRQANIAAAYRPSPIKEESVSEEDLEPAVSSLSGATRQAAQPAPQPIRPGVPFLGVDGYTYAYNSGMQLLYLDPSDQSWKLRA